MVGVEQRKDYHHKDVFLHTLKVVDNICTQTDDVWLRFVALVHDIAKPRTKAYQEGVGWTFHGHEELGARMMKKIFQQRIFGNMIRIGMDSTNGLLIRRQDGLSLLKSLYQLSISFLRILQINLEDSSIPLGEEDSCPQIHSQII